MSVMLNERDSAFEVASHYAKAFSLGVRLGKQEQATDLELDD